jgi:hypothetical protein
MSDILTIKSRGFRYCPFCNKKLKKMGHSSVGKQRWYCKSCLKSTSFKRKDLLDGLWLYRYIQKVLGKTFEQLGVKKSLYYLRTKIFREKNIFLPEIKDIFDQIYLDAIWLRKRKCYLIARIKAGVIGFMVCDSENYENWKIFLSKFSAPHYAITDGCCGMTKAINEVWPTTKIQRCQFHVLLNCKQKLTKHPKNFCRCSFA